MSGRRDRRVWLAMVAFVVGATLLALALPDASRHGPVSVNRQSDGLRAAWRYAEARGWPTQAWRQPLAELDVRGRGVLVLAAPAPAPYRSPDVDAVRRWLMVGGDVILLVNATKPPGNEGELLAALGVERGGEAMTGLQGDAMGALRREVTLAAGADWDPGLPILARMTRWIVRPSPGEERLASTDDARVAVRLRHEQLGRVVVFDDGAMLANGWLGRSGTGNLALFEAVLSRLNADQGLFLDEWHWGLRETTNTAVVAANQRALDLLLGHLVLLYAAVAWTIGRRFGPIPEPAQAPRTSVDRDLRALGIQHARAGHIQELGDLLLAHVRRTSRPGAPALEALPKQFDGTKNDLIALARTIGIMQREGRL
jgi:hypothetical protein